jgi:dTDP-4-amino-4,6-dideoxygalactose transaminase
MSEAFLPFTRPTIDEATIAAVGDVLRSGWLTSGPKVQQLEKTLSEYFGGRPVRCYNSGTCTMEIALRVAGIGPGDEVITTPNSWVATANVILEVGATPVFVDIEEKTRNINLDLVEAAITPRTKAIIPVFMAGTPVDMDKLYDIAKRHKLRVVEDAAQAIGSTWNGKRIGSIGDFVSISFQVNKNIMTAEGGCLVLNNDEEAKLAEKYRLQGVTRSGFDGIDVDVMGGKYNMTDLAGVIGLHQFAHLDEFNAKRKALAKHYFDAFGPAFEHDYGCRLPQQEWNNTNWHMFQVELPQTITRAEFMARMMDRNIGIGYHYAPIHLFTLYRKRGFKEGMFPIAERVGARIVTLPLFPLMTENDVERVVREVKSVLRHPA